MDLSTQGPLAARRHLLMQRRDELLSEVHAAERAARALAATYDVADQKDRANADAESRLLGTQEERDRGELAQVEAALQRLDSGGYGFCADCGDPIPAQRLRVQPAALRCAGCEGVHEGTAAHRSGAARR